jgi:type I restriction enzyme, S subunit
MWVRKTPEPCHEVRRKPFPALKVYRPGALVVAMYGQGATKGRVGILRIPACTNQACCVLEPGGRMSAEWAAYWFIAHKHHIIELAVGSGQPNLNQEIIRSVRLPVPPVPEQERLLPRLHQHWKAVDRLRIGLRSSMNQLQDLKRSLISAAVSGEFDVSAADGSRVVV